MSFTVNMDEVLQQFANVFGSLSPLVWPFVGATLALFVFGGLLTLFRRWSR
ncbi:hypothetical protein JOD02_001852 [Caldicoprobacter guelmensis]|uniref:hypothetical protein n=1 Tax=Caldicoprobacter guelmensis TaxID=1170224 RepID=UPI00195C4D02|nr:hypothetical protein [Caldicoprobacter guelmensis]MBM7582983.1 hypothetical protein [Caldicoprobacter guelmensis]